MERETGRYHFGLGDLIAHNGRRSCCGIVTVVGGRQTYGRGMKLSYSIEHAMKRVLK